MFCLWTTLEFTDGSFHVQTFFSSTVSFRVRSNLIIGVFLISMIRNVPSVQRRMQLFGIYDINKTNGQNGRIYSELNLKIQMINLELWQIGLGKVLLIGLSWWRLERIRYHLHNLSAYQHDVVLQKSVVMKNLVISRNLRCAHLTH